MRWLLFLSRLAFICGLSFVVALVFAMRKSDNQEAFSSTIIIIGVVFGLIVLPITNLCYLGVKVARRKVSEYVPLWLVISNMIFLFILLFYIFYLNDPYYNQA